MRLNTSVVIAAITLLAGFYFAGSPLWIPISVLLSGVIYLVAGPWANSNKVGENVALSMTLKTIVQTIGLWATVGQLMCLGLIVWWAIR